jgi:phosphohistidine phosphatase SixA
MPVLLLRHATAGHRRPGVPESEDRLRPLDARGRRQANALPELYAGLGVDRITSSPYVRCRDSVVPLARALDLEIEERDELAEGAVADEIWSLVAELAPTTAVLCTHGDILGLLLGKEPEKGSTWLVDVEDDRGLARRTYLPPPA